MGTRTCCGWLTMYDCTFFLIWRDTVEEIITPRSWMHLCFIARSTLSRICTEFIPHEVGCHGFFSRELTLSLPKNNGSSCNWLRHSPPYWLAWRGIQWSDLILRSDALYLSGYKRCSLQNSTACNRTSQLNWIPNWIGAPDWFGASKCAFEDVLQFGHLKKCTWILSPYTIWDPMTRGKRLTIRSKGGDTYVGISLSRCNFSISVICFMICKGTSGEINYFVLLSSPATYFIG